MWAKVREEVAAGRQAYVVCPLIGESDKLEVASAEETFARLEADDLSGLRLGLLHGRLPSAEKEAVMARFRAGELQVLVATTVIEVGVDVPNATVMVVLDADRFGIAQLHQLRGRVGRGADASYCYLVTGARRRGRRRRRAGRGQRPARGDGAHRRRLRAGRGRPRDPRRGHGLRRAPEGPQRPQAGLPPARQGGRAARPGGRRAPRRRGPDASPQHPDLDDELRLFLDEEDEAFLFKS